MFAPEVHPAGWEGYRQNLQMKISLERWARVEERVQKAIWEMALDELRAAR
jgi:hypothetical protein